jgi:hypothetical protein
MRKKPGLAYYSVHRKHFCVSVGDMKYKDLTTGEEFEELDSNAIRHVVPEDLLDSTILVEMSDKDHYIRVSYKEIDSTKDVGDLVSIDLDKDGHVVGIKCNYPWPA